MKRYILGAATLFLMISQAHSTESKDFLINQEDIKISRSCQDDGGLDLLTHEDSQVRLRKFPSLKAAQARSGIKAQCLMSSGGLCDLEFQWPVKESESQNVSQQNLFSVQQVSRARFIKSQFFKTESVSFVEYLIWSQPSSNDAESLPYKIVVRAQDKEESLKKLMGLVRLNRPDMDEIKKVSNMTILQKAQLAADLSRRPQRWVDYDSIGNRLLHCQLQVLKAPEISEEVLPEDVLPEGYINSSVAF